LGQYHYLVNKDLGFDKKNLLIIRRPDGLKNKLEDYKNKISSFPGVVSVANSTSIPGSSSSRAPYYLAGSPATRNYSASTYLVSHGFDSTFGINMTQGRFFDKFRLEDSGACVINETMARYLGGSDLLGKILVQPTAKSIIKGEFRIIGIVKDFNYEALENPVMPMVMVLMPGNYEGYLAVRLQPGDTEPLIQQLKTVWENFTNAYPFVHFFLDNDLRSRYDRLKETGRIFSILSVVTLLMACLGLFGLASYTYSRRGFEIGIRKALGAHARIIILFEIRKIIFLLIVSSILAWIGVYILVNSWLGGFAYKIDLNALYFFVPFTAILIIALLTVYYLAYLAANASPGPALKYE